MFLELKQTMLVSVCLYRNYQFFFLVLLFGEKGHAEAHVSPKHCNNT